MNGILVIDKPKGITSRDVVNQVIKKMGIKKVGHTGTLDPIATGVLVVCLGSATKLVEELTSDNKTYIASVLLGVETDTLDSDGIVLKEVDCFFSEDEILNVLKTFVGVYEQEVPIYSAVKINGKKLYEYARTKEQIELPKREVEIKKIELLSDIRYENNKVIFDFKCTVSKGTYIRSLIRDIAYKLNTVGIMTNLRRIRQGDFKIEDAINIDDIEKNKIINIVDAINCKKVTLQPELEKKVLNGCVIDNIYDSQKILFIKDNDAIALYKLDPQNDKKLRLYKMFKGGI